MFFGVHVENGRIKGEAKKALREVIEKHKLDVHITPNQNMILCNVRRSWRPTISKALAAVGLVVSALLIEFFDCISTVYCLFLNLLLDGMEILKKTSFVLLQSPRFVDPLNLTAMACPALPLCPLAIAEAERGAPDILKRVRAMMDKVGLKPRESLVVRITGCPNGCARPYMGELGLVGDGPNSYQVIISFLRYLCRSTRLTES